MMNRYDDQKGKVFALLMNQCDEPVKNKIDSHEDYAKAEKDRDVIALLVKIKTESHDANNEDTKIRIMEHSLCGKLQPIALDEMDPKYAKAADDMKDKMMKNNRDTLMKKGLCFKSKKHGHRAHECPNDDDTNDDKTPEQQHMQQEQQPFGWM